MHYEEFIRGLSAKSPPENMPPLLKALWYDRRNDWERSHTIAQDIPDKNGSRVHAYLHRKEGDLLNAGYWYNKAGRNMPSYALETEWEEIVRSLL